MHTIAYNKPINSNIVQQQTRLLFKFRYQKAPIERMDRVPALNIS